MWTLLELDKPLCEIFNGYKKQNPLKSGHKTLLWKFIDEIIQEEHLR